jgi:Uma2 family endonuclease
MAFTPDQIIRKKGYTIIDGVAYPESDGKPMADNTKQFDWMTTIKLGLEALFKDQSDVFIAGDLLWYPVRGNIKIRLASDVMVAFGRPKGERGSYIQFVENDIPPQVVFEILSPKNTAAEMERKRVFYEQYGVEEFYIYNPKKITLEGWRLQQGRLEPIAQMQSWVSPRLGVRFELDPELKLFKPEGQPILTYVELTEQSEQERQRRSLAEQRLVQERDQREMAEKERDQAIQRAEQERQRAEKLAAKLKELGISLEE